MLTNFRDLGGLICADGSMIAPGKIYRSAVMKNIDDEDKLRLDSLGLDTIFDLRVKAEAREVPDYVPEGCTYKQMDVFDPWKYRYIVVTVRSKILVGHLRGPFEYKLKKNKEDSYEAIALSDVWSEIFDAMDRGETFLFHCTEGKDRTGFCAMLIEHCLGRDNDGIMEEYLLSNELRPPKDRSKLKYIGFSKKLIEDIKYAETTHPELLLRAYAAVDREYGSLDNMLLQKFNVTEERKEKWRKTYVVQNS